MAAERQAMVACERDDKRHQPPEHVGDQRSPASVAHQGNDDPPMHGRRAATDNDEPADPAALGTVRWPSVARERRVAHVAPEDSGRRAICIAADDFGLHTGVNQAVLRLAGTGCVQAIGCMVGGMAWPAWSRLLRRLEPDQVDLGLHLDLTESPLLPQMARPLNSLIRDSFLRRLDARAVRAEIRVQLDAFEQAIGRGPAYIDGHQHVHQFPIVRDELLAELGERYGGCKPWLRSTRRPREPNDKSRSSQGLRLKPWLIEQLGASGLASLALRGGYPQNRRLLGVYDFHGGVQRYSQLLAAWLLAAREGDLLMCHPSLTMQGNDPIIAARNAEFQVLCGHAFAKQVWDAGIVLRPMSRILGRSVVPA